jgi:hypothetical protein
MKRRIFLASLAAALLFGAASARAAQEPSDGVARVTVEELKTLLAGKTPPVVVDVRLGAVRVVKGAVNVPLDQFESRLSELPRDREIVTYCA